MGKGKEVSLLDSGALVVGECYYYLDESIGILKKDSSLRRT